MFQLTKNLDSIGDYYSHAERAVVITSGSSIAVAQLSLPKGTYILTGFVRFPKNANGVRRANFNALSGSTTIQTLVKANGETYDQLNLTNCIKIDESSSTIYLNTYQDSGESLTTLSGGTFMRAIKIG